MRYCDKWRRSILISSLGYRACISIWATKNVSCIQIDGERLGRGCVSNIQPFQNLHKFLVPERIVQIGKKKLVLDHLIVQKMDDDDENGGEDVQSILTYGAQALFDSENTRDITCKSIFLTSNFW